MIDQSIIGKNAIVKMLEELIPPPSTWLGHPEDRIPMWKNRIDKAADYICSHPHLTKKKIDDDRIKKLWYDHAGVERYGEFLNYMNEDDFKAAIKELNK